MKAILAIRDNIKDFVQHSSVFDPETYNNIPLFHRNDLEIDDLLGKGGFNNVYAIRHTRSDPTSPITNTNETYVIKYLKREIVANPSKFQRGATDLAIEALLLSSFDHPNIMKIRGISSTGFSGFESGKEDGFFIIMDRLHETLRERLEIWATMKRGMFKKMLKIGESKENTMFMHRLSVALQLSSAMKYLHDKNIIYRDLKPGNIGFDKYGDLKLTDFGLAREIREEQKLADDTYKMTGRVGTRLYMAPEVARRNPYNLSADVYSFGILLWEICALRKPFYDLDSRMINDFVVHGDRRPNVRKSWPSSINTLMKNCWSKDIHERPDFNSIMMSLEKEVLFHGTNEESKVSSESNLMKMSSFGSKSRSLKQISTYLPLSQ